MPSLSLDDVFGAASTPPPEAPTSSPSTSMSVDDVFGAPPPSPGRDLARGARNLGAVADLVLGLPGQALGVGADIGGRISALARGGSRSDAEFAGKALQGMVPEALTNPVQKLMKVAGYSEGYSDSDVAGVLQKASSWLAKGGEWVEKKTGGALTKADTESLVNTALLGLGARGTAGSVDRLQGRLARGPLPEGQQFGEPYSGKFDPNKGGLPEEPQAPPPPAKITTPEVTAQADIERSLGIKSPAEAKAWRDQRRKDVRSAFQNDNKYAAYLKKYTDGELEAVTARTSDEVLPPEPEPGTPITPGTAAALGGTGLALGALYATDEDKTDLGTAAVLGGAVLLGKGKGFSYNELKGLAADTPLQVLRDNSAYTLLTLERLPGNRFEFPKTMIEQELRRADVTQAEKDVFTAAMAKVDGKDISAKELIAGIKGVTKDWELEKKTSDEYADYGLDAIQRSGPNEGAPSSVDSASTHIWDLPESVEVGTNNHFNDPNYFGHTRVFEEGGVRHVVEIQSDLAQRAKKTLTHEERLKTQTALTEATDLRNLAEDAEKLSLMKPSDYTFNGLKLILQKYFDRLGDVSLDRKLVMGKRMAETALYDSRLRAKVEAADPGGREGHLGNYDVVVDQAIKSLEDGSLQDATAAMAMFKYALREEAQAHSVRASELHANLQNATPAQVAPLLKNWHKRLIREELADAARSGETRVRFATPETVAKVEGWPKQRPQEIVRLNRARQVLDSAEKALSDYEESTIKRDANALTGKPFSSEMRAAQKATIQRMKEDVDRADARWAEAAKAARGVEDTLKLSPEHQGLYDFYAKDVSKFLRQLGGREVIDAQGHGWIEVPTEGSPQLKAGSRSQMFGGVDARLIMGMAAVGLGGMLGAYLDPSNPIEGAILGIAAGVGATRVTMKGLKSVAKVSKRDVLAVAAGAAAGAVLSDKDRSIGAILGAGVAAAIRAFPKDTRLRVGEEANVRDYLEQAYNIEAYKLENQLLDQVSDPARLRVLATTATGLSAKEALVRQALLGFYSKMTQVATAAGALKEGQRIYALREAELSPEARANPIILMGVYANAMGKAAADANLITALEGKAVPFASKSTFIMDGKKAPPTYVTMEHPALRGSKVHPDIVDSLKFVFDASNPSEAMKAVQTFNAATKRIAVMGSLFHAKSLLDAAVGAARINKTAVLAGAAAGAVGGTALGMDPGVAAQIGAGLGMAAGVARTGFLAARGSLSYLKDLRGQGLSPTIDRAMKGGLEFSLERHHAISEDVGSSQFYAGMTKLADFLNSSVPHLGKPVEVLQKMNQVFDTLMWARLHTGLKLSIFDEKFNELKENNARANAADPNKVKLASEEELAHMAASFTNDTFGGLNWRRVADGATSTWGRHLSESVLSPSGRRAAQLLMFAPDWTLSTTRAYVGAFGEGSSVKGLLRPRELADLHRQYILRSAMFYLTAADGINYALSGHHVWENKDWTRLELGDGRTMQFSKHMMEPYHWLMHPGQQALNKLGFIPKQLGEQALGVEYLSAKGRMPPMKESSPIHLVKSLSPISVQQSEQSGVEGSVAGFLGVPIYGKTKEQRAADKRQRERDKRAKERR